MCNCRRHLYKELDFKSLLWLTQRQSEITSYLCNLYEWKDRQSPLIVTLITFFTGLQKRKTEAFQSAHKWLCCASNRKGLIELYRLDLNHHCTFGTCVNYKSQAKDWVSSLHFTDNSGCQSFLSYFRYNKRYISKLQSWRFCRYFYVANSTDQTLEYVDNNMRFYEIACSNKKKAIGGRQYSIDTKINQ